jgi:hypothetical protein
MSQKGGKEAAWRIDEEDESCNGSVTQHNFPFNTQYTIPRKKGGPEF